MNESEYYPPKFTTAVECVAELRVRAFGCARQLLAGEALLERHKTRPINVARLEARLNAWCTAIEVLTVNGNYNVERANALLLARREAATR